RDRGKLSLYGAAMFGIALTNIDRNNSEAGEIVRIIEQYLVQDDENQTAYLDLQRYNNWCWWYWHGSEFETQAYYLKLLMRTNPKSGAAPKLVKYLLNNRRHATYWNSTRDTAICIEAFAEFIRATGEDKPNMTVNVLYNGQVKKTIKITPQNLFEIDNTLILSAEEITAGKHKVELRKRPDGDSRSPLYFNAYLENFSLEDPILKAGLEVKIERRFYKLERDTAAKTQTAGGRGQVVDIKTDKYKREVLASPSAVKSGDIVEVELLIESKNDYESIIIVDHKAAGLEPEEIRSGYLHNANSRLYPYVEFRDERVVFFVERLPRGKHSLTYKLRAEQPGQFSALPAQVAAMYAPELKGNSDEDKVNVGDK
ncbi:MAG: alpha-2-macroglobulin, partial [Planctomycetaceae bacterium]|nr:alpha-2-macroglobulin [Planctomycetaceae bacterium]